LKPVWQVPTDERALFKTAAQQYEGAVLRQTQLKQQSVRLPRAVGGHSTNRRRRCRVRTQILAQLAARMRTALSGMRAK
jgi:hypothetical protein